MRKINWINVGDGEAGTWESSEGRFSIDPNYYGRTTAQNYTLRDYLQPDNKRTNRNYDTVREAKQAASLA